RPVPEIGAASDGCSKYKTTVSATVQYCIFLVSDSPNLHRERPGRSNASSWSCISLATCSDRPVNAVAHGAELWPNPGDAGVRKAAARLSRDAPNVSPSVIARLPDGLGGSTT